MVGPPPRSTPATSTCWWTPAPSWTRCWAYSRRCRFARTEDARPGPRLQREGIPSRSSGRRDARRGTRSRRRAVARVWSEVSPATVRASARHGAGVETFPVPAIDPRGSARPASVACDLARAPPVPEGRSVLSARRADRAAWIVRASAVGDLGAPRAVADELVSRSLALDGPVVAGGDLNEGPNGKAVTWISSRLRDAWAERGEGSGETFRADVPRARIDYLFVGDGVGVERAVVLRGPQAAAVSDHLPLFVDITLGREGAAQKE